MSNLQPADCPSVGRAIVAETAERPGESVNVSRRLTEMARRMPDQIAVAAPRHGLRSRSGKQAYNTLTFAGLDRQSDLAAEYLRHVGVLPGTRIALLVPPGVEFVTLVFALFKAGAVIILIDPGMGPRNLLRCLADAKPQGFVAIPLAQCIRWLLRRRFPESRWNICVSRPLFRSKRFYELRQLGTQRLAEEPSDAFAPFAAKSDDPAAIIFTTGSTGPPKGVLYTHGIFDAQVEQLRDFFGIRPGEVDLAGFPLFGLFNSALGVTTVVPDMDPTRPARVDPRKIVRAVHDWQVTQSFGSPAIWNRVGEHCRRERVSLSSLRRVMSAGAPVPPRVLSAMKACIAPDGEVHTPYGATEALPVASIEAAEVLGETCLRTREGAGVCVGRRFPGIRWMVVEIIDGPIASLADARPLPPGEIGELIVAGPVVTQCYVTRCEANGLARIADGTSNWHRMGDAGYLDEQERFWFCGRVAHRVLTPRGPMYSVCCEAIFNRHPAVFRSALVGIGPRGQQRPVIVVEPWPDRFRQVRRNRRQFFAELAELARGNSLTESITDFLPIRQMPVDIRHNAKIFREKLAVWAARKLGSVIGC